MVTTEENMNNICDEETTVTVRYSGTLNSTKQRYWHGYHKRDKNPLRGIIWYGRSIKPAHKFI